MGFEDFVSESEAANLAGISVATLKRFTEAGYLKVERDADGIPLFSKRELTGVFGVLKDANEMRSFSEGRREGNTTPSFTGHIGGAQNAAAETAAMQAAASQPSAAVSRQSSAPEEQGTRTEKPSASTIVPFPLPAARTAEDTASLSMDSSPSLNSPAHADLVVSLDHEVRRLKTVLDLQEKLLGIREEEIKGLKEERHWLRQRMERMEDKSERDQLLLLSETQTVKKLISLQEQRKSNFRLALEWFGFTKPHPHGEQVIPHVAQPPSVVTSAPHRGSGEQRTAATRSSTSSANSETKRGANKAA